MKYHRRVLSLATLCLVLGLILGYGCAGSQVSAPVPANTEELLITAGFQRWEVNMDTPKRQALLNAIPKRTIVTYTRNGDVLHAYGNDATNTLLIGNEAAYQKYKSLAQSNEMCRQVAGTNPTQFWECMMEPPKGGGPGK